MANWFDNLPPWMQPYGTTVPMPPSNRPWPGLEILPAEPRGAPFQYGPQDKFGVAGVQNAIFGGPYPGSEPPASPPAPPRNPMPAANPPPMMGMPGALPPGANPPSVGMADMPAPPTPPMATTSSAPEGPGWGERNKDWLIPLGDALSGLGQGIAATPPGVSGLTYLSQGAAGANRNMDLAANQRMKQRFQQAQIGELEQKASNRKAMLEFASTIKDPTARSYMKMGMAEKAISRLEKIDPAEAQRIIDFEVKKAEALLPGKLALAHASKSSVNVNNFPKPPAGYRWKEDGSLDVIPGGPATTIPAEQAGRLALGQNALKQLPEARKVFLRKWTTLDDAAAQAEMGEIGRAQRTIRTAIESGLRMMTGAAAPESEVANYLGLFMPKSFDSIETRKQKLDNLEAFMRNAAELTMRGRSPSTPSAPPATPTMPNAGTSPGGLKYRVIQ